MHLTCELTWSCPMQLDRQGAPYLEDPAQQQCVGFPRAFSLSTELENCSGCNLRHRRPPCIDFAGKLGRLLRVSVLLVSLLPASADPKTFSLTRTISTVILLITYAQPILFNILSGRRVRPFPHRPSQATLIPADHSSTPARLRGPSDDGVGPSTSRHCSFRWWAASCSFCLSPSQRRLSA